MRADRLRDRIGPWRAEGVELPSARLSPVVGPLPPRERRHAAAGYGQTEIDGDAGSCAVRFRATDAKGRKMEIAGLEIDVGVAVAMDAKKGPNLSPAESPPGKHLAEMDRDTLALVLVAIEGTTLQLQQAAFTRRMRPEQHDDFIAKIGRLQTAGNQLRRHLAATEPAA